MKLAAWNVNSLKVRLDQVLEWLAQHQPDALCLQETKLEDANFPVEAFREAGWQVAYTGQKTYNGVAIVSPHAIEDVQAGIPGFADEQKRLIAGTVNGVYAYKLAWLQALHDWLRGEVAAHPHLALLGDYNIAPDDRDVHDPAAWAGQVLCSEPERAAFRNVLDLGLADSYRLFEQPSATFSWWDYRQGGFRRNLGLRIDHILLTPDLARRCTAAGIDTGPRKHERPSDHAPVWAELAAGGD
ncbi:MAG: exodeoxyribonuclease III [Betaproteobacteria bacterium]|nr:exodeoxyribonuclease III [Betaproteobacteria bacterium]